MGLDLDKMRDLRKQKRIPQREMSLLLGFKSVSAYSRKESGERPISTEEIARIAQQLEVRVQDLFI
jgi:transcriptional regulator with XRE-family HTH domain